MSKLILFNKPFHVMSQFKDSGGRETLANYIKMKAVYPAGRLDYDSEGLLALTDDGQLQHYISHPHKKLIKTYFVQVEGLPDEAAIRQLQSGVDLKDGRTRPAKVSLVEEPDWIWPRNPPVRQRLSVPTAWLKISISEGRNRQVRRMSAAVGHPTLRLIRFAIGSWTLENLQPGEYRIEEIHLPQKR